MQHRFKSAKPRLQGLAFESPALPASRSCRRTPQHSSNSFHYRSRNPAFLTFCPRPPACIPAKETSSHGAMTLRTSNYFHRVQHYQQEHDAKHAHSKRRCLRVESTHASVLAAAHPMLTHFRSRTALTMASRPLFDVLFHRSPFRSRARPPSQSGSSSNTSCSADSSACRLCSSRLRKPIQ